MISCVDFIPAYSALFQFIEDHDGYEGVVKYWEYISDRYVQPLLGKEVEQNGLMGCWNYWSRALNEEAADFTMEYNPDRGRFSIDMHRCPSKGKLLELEQMQPYPRYCDHCDLLYRRVLEQYGYKYTYDATNADNASCLLTVEEK